MSFSIFFFLFGLVPTGCAYTAHLLSTFLSGNQAFHSNKCKVRLTEAIIINIIFKEHYDSDDSYITGTVTICAKTLNVSTVAVVWVLIFTKFILKMNTISVLNSMGKNK